MGGITNIRSYIRALPEYQPFTARCLDGQASYVNVRKVLTRLLASQEITRVTRGMFVRTKKSLYSQGAALPTPEEVLGAITQTSGEAFTVQGAAAANLLHLSTQIPMQVIYAVEDRAPRL